MKGFTLIELLIVSAIVGLLAAVIIPALKHHPTSHVIVITVTDLVDGHVISQDTVACGGQGQPACQ